MSVSVVSVSVSVKVGLRLGVSFRVRVRVMARVWVWVSCEPVCSIAPCSYLGLQPLSRSGPDFKEDMEWPAVIYGVWNGPKWSTLP